MRESCPAHCSGSSFTRFLLGARAGVSVPGLILVSTLVGFAGLAKDAGFGFVETMFMVEVI